jgi:hypothetical protein
MSNKQYDKPKSGSSDSVTAQIVSVISVPATEPDRLGKFDTRVTYRVGTANYFTVTVPKEHPTAAEIEAAIKADYAQRKELLGRTIQL